MPPFLIFKIRMLTLIVLVMVKFLCQLGWAMGCPDICSNVILGDCVRVFLEINIETVDCVKQIALHSVGGPHPIS